MISFIKSYDRNTIKNKFLVLYILNVTGIIFTRLLLNTGFYVPGNILLAKTVQSPAISFVLIIILPALLLYYIHIRMHASTTFQLKISNIIINLTLFFFILITISQLILFCLLDVWVY